jgi:hypothetical protein
MKVTIDIAQVLFVVHTFAAVAGLASAIIAIDVVDEPPVPLKVALAVTILSSFTAFAIALVLP